MVVFTATPVPIFYILKLTINERGLNLSPLSKNLWLRVFLQSFEGFLYFVVRQDRIFEFAG